MCKQALKWIEAPWVVAEAFPWGEKAAADNSRANRQLGWIEDLCRLIGGSAPLTGLDTWGRPIDEISSDEDDDVKAPSRSVSKDSHITSPPKAQPFRRQPHPPFDLEYLYPKQDHLRRHHHHSQRDYIDRNSSNWNTMGR